MTNPQFSEFLKKKQERATLAKKIDWRGRRRIWVNRLEKLLQEITNTWLYSYESEGLLEAQIDKIAIREEVMGEWGLYDAPRMTIKMASETVTLTPVGMVIFGGLGRVDMVGPLGKLMIILNDSDQAPSFRATRIITRFPGEMPAINSAEAGAQMPIPMEDRMVSAEWYFVPPNDRRTMLRVTEETFTEQLQSIVRP